MGLAAPRGAAEGLVVTGLTYRAGRRVVLRDLSLSVPRGHVTAILGGHGSGKSVLMEILAGFRPGRFDIRLDGREVAHLAAHRRGFGVVQQRDALFDHMTLAENVAFPLRVRHIAGALRARMVGEALELVQLGHLGLRRPGEVSAGERQLAMLARASVFAPPLLLLDEPAGSQEPECRAALAASLRRIHDLLGTTTLLATRHWPDALAVADMLGVLRDGVLVQHGPVAEVFDRPCDAQVAALLGSTGGLPGTVAALEDDLAVVRLACGPVVEARAAPAIRPGAPCLLVVRPDRIAIAPVDAAGMGEGAIDATVIGTRFLGETNQLRLLIGSGAELVVRRPAGAGLRGLSAGARVAIAWQPHHATAFPP